MKARRKPRHFGHFASQEIATSCSELATDNRLVGSSSPPSPTTQSCANGDFPVQCESPRGEHVNHFETVRQRKDGSLVEILLTISPLIDDSGKIIGASKIARHHRAKAGTDQLAGR